MGDVSAARAAISIAVDAMVGWTASRFAPELFGRDTDHLAHHAFVVGVPSTEIAEPDRQSLTDGAFVWSTVDVQWAHRLKADDQPGDYADALDAEQALVKACVGLTGHHVLVQRLVRKAIPEGWVLGTATFRVLHAYALS